MIHSRFLKVREDEQIQIYTKINKWKIKRVIDMNVLFRADYDKIEEINLFRK